VTLNDWERNGWLQAHRTTPEEVADLLALVERDLADSRTSGLSADWRMNIAYNAALQAATAALAASGYRASRDQHHYRVIQSLELTIGADRKIVTAWTLSGRSGTLGATKGPAAYPKAKRERCENWRRASPAMSGLG
jgi:hypothetical protein